MSRLIELSSRPPTRFLRLARFCSVSAPLSYLPRYHNNSAAGAIRPRTCSYMLSWLHRQRRCWPIVLFLLDARRISNPSLPNQNAQLVFLHLRPPFRWMGELNSCYRTISGMKHDLPLGSGSRFCTPVGRSLRSERKRADGTYQGVGNVGVASAGRMVACLRAWYSLHLGRMSSDAASQKRPTYLVHVGSHPPSAATANQLPTTISPVIKLSEKPGDLQVSAKISHLGGCLSRGG